MEAKESLSESIQLYKAQLSQINETLNVTPAGQERDNLLSLKNDIEELLKLTQDNIDSLQKTESNSKVVNELPDDDPFCKEYALFKAELESLDCDYNADRSSSEQVTSSNGIADDDDAEEEDGACIQDELQALIGSKCRAPYVDKSGSVTYYNALISGIQMEETLSDIEHIKVRVLFINPTEKKMIPCPYFLDDKCKFNEENCNFSHGYLALFDQLKEYIEPDFTTLKLGCRVLAKLPNINTWVSTVIEDIGNNGKCVVKNGKSFTEIPIYDVLPPFDDDDKGQSLDYNQIDDDIDDDIEEGKEASLMLAKEQHKDAMIELSLTREQPTNQLGQWEQFTKGIGSKLMAKMGYIVGTGLGKSGEGILQPVEPVVLPAGKSLDHCMNLKEAAGGSSNNLLTVEKMQKKLAAKVLAKSKREYFRQKKQDKAGVFHFINNTIRAAPSTSTKNTAKYITKNLRTVSDRQLNVERFKLAECIKQSERNMKILKQQSIRTVDNQKSSILQKNLANKLEVQQRELLALKHCDTKLEVEQIRRTTKKKMTVF